MDGIEEEEGWGGSKWPRCGYLGILFPTLLMLFQLAHSPLIYKSEAKYYKLFKVAEDTNNVYTWHNVWGKVISVFVWQLQNLTVHARDSSHISF